MQPATTERIEAAYQTALSALLTERTPDGHWIGELSTSSLSTATAVMALHLVQANGGPGHPSLIASGLKWLADHQNPDGGWGDTTVSLSNISTTMLCRSAFYLTKPMDGSPPPIAALMMGLEDCAKPHHERSDWWGFANTITRAEAWLTQHYGPPNQWPEAIRQRYGKDRTFATPILTTCALAGLVLWDEVPPLPFELAVLPQSWFRFVKMHVVSYALPALIAIGQCIYFHKRPWNPLTRLMRALSRKRTLRVLQNIQPSSGGYLEAIPLTSFVTMSLASIGHADHPVAREGVRFIVNSVRPDGSWPIDTNVATWVTTLAVNALAAAGELESLDRKEQLRDWILNQQYKVRHPYTGADPGGWAWTDLPGGVPDADDTPGAILALSHLSEVKDPIQEATLWLLGLQNRDGGLPTFCRGWGHLPFDRSGTDLTAHFLRSLINVIGLECTFQLAHGNAPKFRWPSDAKRLPVIYWTCVTAIPRAIAYLARTQRPDGSWLPLWFGNQHMPNDENPTYGTSRVLASYRDLGMMNTLPAQRGIAWLLQNQNLDGGWGGGLGSPSSIEETALALDILVDLPGRAEPRERPVERASAEINLPLTRLGSPSEDDAAVNKAVAWLVERIENNGLSHPTPIGFYFAKLWYFEKLYPIIFSVSALGRVRKTS